MSPMPSMLRKAPVVTPEEVRIVMPDVIVRVGDVLDVLV